MKTAFSTKLVCGAVGFAWIVLSACSGCAQTPTSLWTLPQAPDAPQLPTLPPVPTERRLSVVMITIERAIDLAKKNNPTLLANETLIQQSRAEEITASLRPNPLLAWDAQFLPIFEPSLFSSAYIDEAAQFDVGLSYLFERGKKRQRRLQAARDLTAVTESQVADAQRTLIGTAAQRFVVALLANSNLEFAQQLLQSFRHTVEISGEQHKAGAMSKADYLKIRLQTLQFERDVATARITKVQALALLRQALGFDSVPREYDVAGALAYESLQLKMEELQAKALASRPDLKAAQRAITSATSQVALAKANGKQDLTVTFDYNHLNASNLGSFFFNIPLPIFNRNQGEVARMQYALTQSHFQ